MISDTGCGFITKLNNTGSALVYSTYLGETFSTRLTAIAFVPTSTRT